MIKAAIKSLIEEIGWLLGSYLLALVLPGVLTGSPRVWVSGFEIQMHNTYFILGPATAGLLFFLPVATLMTLVRAKRAGFRPIGPNLVLGLLTALWFLFWYWAWGMLKGIR